MISILMQTDMLLRKMGPRPEDEVPKTDAEIVDEVVKERTKSRTSTFLARLGVGSSSRKNAASAARIKDLEEKLAEQENLALEASVRYKKEMEARMEAQDLKFEEQKLKQEEQLAALKKAQEEKALADEKKQQETEALLSFLLRTSQNSSQATQ